MSEDRPDSHNVDPDPAAPEVAAPTTETASEPATADAAPTDPAPVRTRRSRRLVALLAFAAIVAVAVTIIIVRGTRRRHGAPPVAMGSSSGAAIRAPEGPRLPGADGVQIGGTVIDGAGTPVAGAEVTAELERGGVDPALAGAPSDGSGSGGGSGSAASPMLHTASPTGTDGRFAVVGLTPGRYRIRVTGPGLLPAEVRFVPVPSDEARIVVARQVRIDGTVLDDTTPVAHAYVGLRGEAIGGTIETRTDARGAFQFPDLPEGRYQLFAWQQALVARTVRVSRLGAGPFDPIELHLESGTIVVGRVIDRDEGTGIVAAVELRPIGDDQAPRYARSGDDGVFRIEGIPNGDWIADAFAPGYTSPGGVQLAAGRGIPELALVAGGTIEGQVVDGDGQPVAGATVRALGAGPNAPELSAEVDRDRLRRFSGRMIAPTPVTGVFSADPLFIPRGELGVTTGPIPPIPPPGSQIATRQASLDPVSAAAHFVGDPPPLDSTGDRGPIWVTGTDGRYRIRGLTRGKVVVLATAPGYAEGRSKRLAIDLGQTIPKIDIVLTPGTLVVGRVTDQHGAPVVGAQVTATPEIGAALSGFTDIEGLYQLGPLTGTIELAANAYGHADARRTVELPPAKGPTPAAHREDLVLAVADAILAGTLDDATGAAVAGATIEILGGAGEGRRAVVGDDGTFSIDLLPEAVQHLRITHPDYPPIELDAAASAGGKVRVRLRIPLGGAVAGALLDDATGSPLGGLAITASGPKDALAGTTTDKTGRWRLGPLAPGRWKLVVKQVGFVPLAYELDVPVSHAPGAISVRDVRLELLRGALAGGTVRDARGLRAAGAAITVQRADGTGPVAEGTTDPAGEFRVRDCPSGNLVVTATKGDATGSTRVTLRPGDEVLSLAIDLR